MLDDGPKQNAKSIAAVQTRAHRDKVLRRAIIIEIDRAGIAHRRHGIIVIDAGKRCKNIARNEVRTTHHELIRITARDETEHGKESNPIERVFHFAGLHGSFVVAWSARIVSGDLFQSPRKMLSPRYAVLKLVADASPPVLNSCGENAPGDPVAYPTVMPIFSCVQVSSFSCAPILK